MSTVRVSLVVAWAVALTVPIVAAQRGQPPAVTAVSQVPPPATALETLLTAPGLLVSRDLYRVTDDRLAQSFGLTIDAIVARSSASHLLGLRVEVTEPGTTPKTRVSYVDQGELAGLSQDIGQMLTMTGQWTGREDARASEGQLATLGGFVIGFHQDFKSQYGFIGAGTVDPSRTKCAVQDFVIIKSDIDSAIALLRDK